jgi:translation initiation factor IF-2
MADGRNRPNRPIRPRGGSSGRKRRVVIEGGGARSQGRQPRDRGSAPQTPRQPPAAPPSGPVTVESGVTVKDLSQALGVPMPDLIKILMNMGQMRTATQSLSDEEVELIATEVSREVTIKHAAEEELEPAVFDDADEELVPRPPVVTIMGHVDHGKTTLLDAIRSASVVETEQGGITQHIGAYQAEVDGRKITFLDTPGHEAFTAMRARGAKVTDIAVLVVAADDGVMPQTKESISHARAAEVPIVVAVNKMDVPDANADRVKSELAAEGLQPEDWGGSTQFSEVSAKQQTNLADLLEKILLVADAELDLRAKADAEASGVVIESRLDVGRGPVATVLVHRGTLRVGDAAVAGDASGKVRALHDYRGERVQEAKPGEPVEVLGFDHPPSAGEFVRVVEHERQAKHLANLRAERLRREQLAQRPRRRVSLETLHADLQAGEVQDLNIVLKGDVQGSVEALLGELQKIQHSEVRVNVIHTGVGGITENDVNLASASDALVIGFNVRPSADARALAEREGVDIRTYRVIYQLTDDIQQALVGMLSPVQTEETLGEAEVRALFRVSRLGTIAGCMVTSGVVRRGAQVRVVRDGTVVHETSIAQLKRFKDDAREVAEGFECGILLDGFNDVKEGDVLEAFETREIERTDLEPAPVAAAAPADDDAA